MCATGESSTMTSWQYVGLVVELSARAKCKEVHPIGCGQQAICGTVGVDGEVAVILCEGFVTTSLPRLSVDPMPRDAFHECVANQQTAALEDRADSTGHSTISNRWLGGIVHVPLDCYGCNRATP